MCVLYKCKRRAKIGTSTILVGLNLKKMGGKKKRRRRKKGGKRERRKRRRRFMPFETLATMTPRNYGGAKLDF